jgi:ferredoxin
MKYCAAQDLCTGHGRCYTNAPEVFSADDDGFIARRDEPVEVPPEHEAAAELGARACPERAISIEN